MDIGKQTSIHPLTRKKQEAQERFLKAYSQIGTIVHAAAAVEITPRCVHLWSASDANFADRLAVAREEHTQLLEQTMFQRLSHPEKNLGSDILLMFALKARRPEVYRELPPPQPDSARSLLDSLKGALQAGSNINVRALELNVQPQAEDTTDIVKEITSDSGH